MSILNDSIKRPIQVIAYPIIKMIDFKIDILNKKKFIIKIFKVWKN